MADPWVPQPHYTGGALTYFWDGKELIEMRMADQLLRTAVRAAEALRSRYFFREIGHHPESDTRVWGAFDRHTPRDRAGGLSLTPLKTFRTNDTAPLIMWAAAKGGL